MTRKIHVLDTKGNIISTLDSQGTRKIQPYPYDLSRIVIATYFGIDQTKKEHRHIYLHEQNVFIRYARENITDEATEPFTVITTGLHGSPADNIRIPEYKITNS